MTYSTLDDFLKRARTRLAPVSGDLSLEEGGDIEHVPAELASRIRPAAVLIGVIPRETAPTVLLTRRPDTMASHPGQVAFPGGKIDPVDEDDVDAALREAEEEVGVIRKDVELVARAAPYVTGTAYRITPVIGVLPPDFEPIPDPTEVADVFEVPLSFLLDKSNYQHGEGVWLGQRRTFVEMPWQGFRIWGVTAGIIRVLYETLYESET